MKNTKINNLIPIIIDHVTFKVTSTVDSAYIHRKTIFTKLNGAPDDIFCNIDYGDLSTSKSMNLTIYVSIYFKGNFVPLGLSVAPNYNHLKEEMFSDLYVLSKEYVIS